MPITISLLVAGGALIAKTADSAISSRKAKKEAEEIRSGLTTPTAEMDPELLQMYSDIENQGLATEMPQLAGLRNRQMSAASGMLGDISNMAGGGSAAKIGALQGLYEKSILPGEADMASQTASFVENQKQLKQRSLMSLLPQIASQRRYMYEQNELNPYARGLAESAALEQASIQHKENMYNTLIQGGMMMAGGFGQAGGFSGANAASAASVVPGTTASNAASAMGNFGNMAGSYGSNYGAQAGSFGNYGTPTTGSGMGNMWQGQLGNSFGGGYYDPTLGTWVTQ